MAERIPPKDHLATSHDVERVAHGWEVQVHVRSLNLTQRIDEHGARIMGWLELTRTLREAGVDLETLLHELPHVPPLPGLNQELDGLDGKG